MTCLEIHRHVLKIDEKQLNVKSQESLKRSRRPWLLYHADVFHLRLLCSPTFWTPPIFDLASVPLSPLRFTLSIDTPPTPSFLCHCVSQEGEKDWVCLQLQPSHKTSCLLFLLISSRCATSWPPSPSHFIPKLSSSHFVLPLVSPLVSLWLIKNLSMFHLWSFCFPRSGHPCVEARHHHQHPHL